MADEKKKIMVATDGSEAAEHAVRYAARLAKRRGTELFILFAVSYKKIGYWAFIDAHFKKELKAKANEALEKAEKIAKEYDVRSSTEMRESESYTHTIIADVLQERRDIWVLVMGDKGQDLEARQAVGSTTHGVLHELAKRSIPVPLLVVPFVADVEKTI